MKDDLLEKINKLRIAVGYMTEQMAWWDTKFFAPASNDFLAYIFPKSIKDNSNFFLDAIRFLVDKEVGANYYHLFRLPMELEEQLRKKTSQANEKLINTEEMALKVLEQLSDSLTVEKNEGPINIGSSDKMNADIVQVFAAQYYSAFNKKYKVYPYLN